MWRGSCFRQWRGTEFGRNHLFPADGVAPTGFAYVSPYPAPAAAVLQRGLAAALLEDTRWARCDVKSVALLANVLLRQEAHDQAAVRTTRFVQLRAQPGEIIR